MPIIPPPSGSLRFDFAHHKPPREGENKVLPLDGGGSVGVIERPISKALILVIGPYLYGSKPSA